jgi:hypothetical protein
VEARRWRMGERGRQRAVAGARHGLAVAGDRWRCSRSSAVGLSWSQSRGLVAGEGGGWSPAAAGGGHGRCMGKSRPVARRRRLCLREADCGEGGVWSRATQKVGPGRIDGKDTYPLVSGSFKLEYTDTSRIRIRCVSGAYPYDCLHGFPKNWSRSMRSVGPRPINHTKDRPLPPSRNPISNSRASSPNSSAKRWEAS